MTIRYRTTKEWEILKKSKDLRKAETPEACDTQLSRRREEINTRVREYMRARREFRKDHPAFMEIDRLKHNKAMRKYRTKRAATDPAFVEACRTANRKSQRRRRAAARNEIDET